MDGTHTIEIKTGRFSYHLELTQKITLLGGASGTGKSTLINAITWLYETRPDEITSTAPIIALIAGTPLSELSSTIANNPNSIICIDEWLISKAETILEPAINSSNSYFILITRTQLNNTPYSPRSLKILVTDSNNHHKLQSSYKKADKDGN